MVARVPRRVRNAALAWGRWIHSHLRFHLGVVHVSREVRRGAERTHDQRGRRRYLHIGTERIRITSAVPPRPTATASPAVTEYRRSQCLCIRLPGLLATVHHLPATPRRRPRFSAVERGHPPPAWRRRRAARNLACRERCRGWIARHEYSYRRWRGPARPPGVGGHAGGESALAGDLRQGDLTRQGDLSPLKIRHKLGPGIARRTTPIICCREDPAVSLSFSVVRPDRGPPNSD